MSNESVRIGVHIIDRPTVLRRQSDYAAWYDDIEVQPGEYPAFLYQVGSTRYVGVSLPGVRVDEYHAAHYGGVPVSREPYVPRGIGEPLTYRLQSYDYIVAGAIAEGSPHWRLDAGWQVRPGSVLLYEPGKYGVMYDFFDYDPPVFEMAVSEREKYTDGPLVGVVVRVKGRGSRAYGLWWSHPKKDVLYKAFKMLYDDPHHPCSDEQDIEAAKLLLEAGFNLSIHRR